MGVLLGTVGTVAVVTAGRVVFVRACRAEGMRAAGLAAGALPLDALLPEAELDEPDALLDELDELPEELLDELLEEEREDASHSESFLSCATALATAGAGTFCRGGLSTIPPNLPFTALVLTARTAAVVFAGAAGLTGGTLLASLSLSLPLELLLEPLLERESELDEEDALLLLGDAARTFSLLTGAAAFCTGGFTADAAAFLAAGARAEPPSSAENFLCRYSICSSRVTTSDSLAGMSLTMALQRCTATT
jgi:hypothetical protein